MLKKQLMEILEKPSVTDAHKKIINSHKLYESGSKILCDIAPDDKLQFWDKIYISPRVNASWQLFSECFDLMKPHTDLMEICMEISKVGRLHYHINIIVKNGKDLASIIGFMMNRFQCKVEIDTIADWDYRQAYVRKDTSNTGRFCIYHGTPDEVEEVELKQKRPKKKSMMKKDEDLNGCINDWYPNVSCLNPS